jgi:hypothetical protein
VLHDGAWVPGVADRLTARDGNGWRAFVRYTTSPGSGYVQWRSEHEVRPVDLGRAWRQRAANRVTALGEGCTDAP